MAKSKKSSAAAKAAAAKPSHSLPEAPEISTLISGAPAERAQWRSVVIRVRFLHEEMRAGRYPNSSLMEKKFGVKRHTTLRDIAAMHDSMDMPIAYDSTRKGYYYTRPVPADLPRPRFSAGDALAFCLARRALERFRGTGFARQLIEGLRKVTAEIEGEVPFEWDALDQFVSFGGVELESTPEMQEISDRIAHALVAFEELEIRYRKPRTREYEWRRVQPLHLRLHLDGVYLLARALNRSDNYIRPFLLSRIGEARLTGRTFQRRANFDPAAVFRHSIGIYPGGKPERVRLRLSTFAANWFSERPLHATQRITDIVTKPAKGRSKAKQKSKAPAAPDSPAAIPPDQAAELTMNVAVTPELEREILGWGLEVEVLAPASLREKLLATVKQMAARLSAAVPKHSTHS
jgi:predicted DNA-binding transcriptional regulator YafY